MKFCNTCTPGSKNSLHLFLEGMGKIQLECAVFCLRTGEQLWFVNVYVCVHTSMWGNSREKKQGSLQNNTANMY